MKLYTIFAGLLLATVNALPAPVDDADALEAYKGEASTFSEKLEIDDLTPRSGASRRVQ